MSGLLDDIEEKKEAVCFKCNNNMADGLCRIQKTINYLGSKSFVYYKKELLNRNCDCIFFEEVKKCAN